MVIVGQLVTRERRESRKRSMSLQPEEVECKEKPLKVEGGDGVEFVANGRYNGEEALINKKLPKELLLKIFSFLDIVSLCRCAQVSKEWNVLALDGSNWQSVDLFSFQKDVSCGVIRYLSLRCGGFLRRICLRGCQGIQDEALFAFSKNCPNIEEVILSSCPKLTDDSVVALAMACRNIHTLFMDSCVQLTDRSLRSFTRLRHVDISWCNKISNVGIGMIAGETLLRFSAKGCSGLDNEGLIKLARRSPNLEHLNLQCCVFVSDAALASISQSCHKLKLLCVSGCSQLTDASPQALAQGCPLLDTLEMANCNRCSDAGLIPLIRACHSLRRLDLEECALITDSTLSHLASFCPLIEKLSLSHCDQITDAGVQRLAHNLRRLSVIEIDNCPFISDQTLDQLAQESPALQRVELYDCQLITKEAITKFSERRPGVRLHTYFAPATPLQTEPPGAANRHRYCRCCVLV